MAAAVSAYEEAVTFEGSARRFARLGFARSKIGDWIGAASAYESALLRRTHVQRDAHLREFLSHNIARRLLTTRALFGGAKGFLGRHVVVELSGIRKAYFEHCKDRPEASRCVVSFYEALERRFGAAFPDFIPRLHHYSERDGQTYFLYDYLEPRSNLTQKFRGPHYAFDPEIAVKAVNCLTRVTTELADTFHKAEPCSGVMACFSACAVRRALENELHKTRQSSESIETLRTICKRWPRLVVSFDDMPRGFAHGDLHCENAILSSDGQIKVVDWETFGKAPLGFDLISLFEAKLDHPQFEDVIDLYFDSVGARIRTAERRRAVALLALFSAVAKAKPLPTKWLKVLAKR